MRSAHHPAIRVPARSLRFWLLLALYGLLSANLIGCQKRPQPSPEITKEHSTGKSSDTHKASTKSRNATPDLESGSLSPSPRAADPSFYQDVASQYGIDAVYRNDEEAGEASILESLGGGVAAFDFDNDSLPDLFFPGGGKISDRSLPGLPAKLYRNLLGQRFVDVTNTAGTTQHEHYSHGAFASDFDNDGFIDLLMTGYGGLTFWQNQGDGTFNEIHQAAKLIDDSWSSSAAWGDINGDGLLDLYVAHYVDWNWTNHPNCLSADRSKREVCSPGDFKGLQDTLFLNRGDGTFQDASTQYDLKPGGKGLGVVLHDIDQDGKLDVYVANDTEPNFCYINKDGKFVEQAHRMGVAIDDEGIPNGSMGVDLCDYNRDAKPDLWAANYERESFALYRNEGAGFFLHVSRASGITALGGLFVGFGTAFTDVNGDGWEDIVIANGHVIKYPLHASRKQKPLLLLNQRGKFIRQKFESPNYFAVDREGRGLAQCDFNADGLPDIVISNLNEPAALLKHNQQGFDHSLVIELIGTRSSRDPIGATVTLVSDAPPIVRYRKGGSSYLSSAEAKLFFAWPKEVTPHKLIIRWPSGTQTEIDASQLSPRMTIVEPNG